MNIMRVFAVLVCLLWFGALVSRAGPTHYVAHGGQPATPLYESWDTAASNIQDAINVTDIGDTVLVSNGVYDTGGVVVPGYTLTNRVYIDKAITLRSANNEPANTIIKGASDNGTNGPAAIRCVYMAASSSLIGFMLTNGATINYTGTEIHETRGGGVHCPQITSPIISNCVIAGNQAGFDGGGTWYGTLYNCTVISNYSALRGGGTRESTVYNSTLTNNWAYWGGGAYGGTLSGCTNVGNSAIIGGGTRASTLYNCTLIANSASTNLFGVSTDTKGGGAYGGTLSNCTVVGNFAGNEGGGIAGEAYIYNCTIISNFMPNEANRMGGGVCYGTIVSNCTLIGNSARNGGASYHSTLYNCLVAGNTAFSAGGGISGWMPTYNCTIVGNSAATGGGVRYAPLINCIVYFNTATTGSNWYEVAVFTNNCLAPAATGGVGNITFDPLLVNNGSDSGTNHILGNYRLSVNSPCINKGTNEGWMTGAVDRDGRRRLDKFSLQVDMGCYEHIPNGTLFRIP